MTTLLSPESETRQRSKHQFYIHAGAKVVDLETVKRSHTPEATDTWCPVPHGLFVESAMEALNNSGYEIRDSFFALGSSKKDEAKDTRLFSLFMVNAPSAGDAGESIEWAVGLRNSHDKTVSMRVAMGTRVFVCDNLAFSGELNLSRKHTGRILEDMPTIMNKGMSYIDTVVGRDKLRLDMYKAYGGDRGLRDEEAHHHMIELVRKNIVTTRSLPKIVEQWHAPEHVEFENRNAWSLFNACTSVRDIRQVNRFVSAGVGLHHYFDHLVGMPVTKTINNLEDLIDA